MEGEGEVSLTAERLRELLDYDPVSGEMRWRVARSSTVKVGALAGCIHKFGYRVIRIGKKQYKAHRLAWLHLYGEWPTHQVDHIDGDRSKNSAANMRLATNSQNQANRGINKNNTSGYKGVYWHTGNRKWEASIMTDGKVYKLGMFANPEDASSAYIKAAARLHGEFAKN
jgi:hypothetical protein